MNGGTKWARNSTIASCSSASPNPVSNLRRLGRRLTREGFVMKASQWQWNSDDPGAGADSVEVYAFEDLFFVNDDSGIDGAYETFSDAADDCMLLEVNNTTVRIWVDLHLNSASEESE
jgi:hypothetical protein